MTAAILSTVTLALNVCLLVFMILESRRDAARKCEHCVWHMRERSGELVCKVDNHLPYRSTLNGKPVKNPARYCRYYIEHHTGNRSLEFTVQSK